MITRFYWSAQDVDTRAFLGFMGISAFGLLFNVAMFFIPITPPDIRAFCGGISSIFLILLLISFAGLTLCVRRRP